MHQRNFFWIGLGALAVAARYLLGHRPEWIESLYSRGLFLGIRWSIDYLLAWSPIPLIYLFILGLLFGLVRWTRRFIGKKASAGKKILDFGLSTFAFMGGVVFLFQFLWGFNYGRIPLERQLGLHPEPLTPAQLREELDLETHKMLKYREILAGADTSALSSELAPPDMERQLRAALVGWLGENDFPSAGRVRGRLLYPRGIFLRFSSAGLYFPFTGEGHVDAGLHSLQVPYTMAHEMAHGYGFTDEGVCNFLAYLACARSEDPFIAYAGRLSYWRALAANFRAYNRENYPEWRARLPAGLRADLDAINDNMARYPDLMPKLRDYAYDAYLKSQGVQEGMLSYNRVIMLARAWRLARQT
jgi:hypothetical protein